MKRIISLLIALSLCLTAALASAQTMTYADTIAWDGEYDVIVVGFGGAGATAAATAADNGANVLLIEKAPEGKEGGNTRVCGQLFVYGHEDEEATYNYYKQLGGENCAPDDMIRYYTQNIAHMYDVLSELFGLDKADFYNYDNDPVFGALVKTMSPEYPEFAGADKISLDTLHYGLGDGYLWQNFRKLVTDREEQIDVWFESPAEHLIQDPVSRIILGVQAQREGETVNVRAKNGVVLATGGFENNPEMVETYLGFAHSAYFGGGYNTGDGVRMASEVGADMWHMDVYEGSPQYGSFVVEEGTKAESTGATSLHNGSVIFVGADGSRIMREDETSRHGHLYEAGIWVNPHYAQRNFIVYDAAQAEVIAANNGIPEAFVDQIIKADTLAELAEATGMDAGILVNTIANFNMYAETGVDYEQGRAPESMTAFAAEGPYYAIECIPAILNTQGGPRRNVNAEIIGLDGNPIPHLYSAGELGGITGLQYQGGGNIAECVIFGQVAGRNAAAEKTDAPAELVKAESNLRFTIGSVEKVEEAIEVGENEYVGTSEKAMGGKLQIKVTVVDGAITAIETLVENETDGLGDVAIERLIAEAIAGNTAELDTVGGATVSSNAFVEALNDALAQVK